MDPDQGIEEEYMNKNNQLFCWRTLRSLAEVDLKSFSGQKGKTSFRFEGNVEEAAQLLSNKEQGNEQQPED